MKSFRDVEDQVTRLVTSITNVVPESADMNLFESDVLDSLGMIDLIVALEEGFHVEIPLEELDIDEFHSVASIVAFIVDRVELQVCQPDLANERQGGAS